MATTGYFQVAIDGRALAVARVSGLALAADATGLARGRGGEGWQAPALPPRLTLARPVDDDRTLWDWRREALDGKPALRKIEVTLLDSAGRERVEGWRAEAAWPLAWRGPTLDAASDGLAFEEIDLVAERLERV